MYLWSTRDLALEDGTLKLAKPTFQASTDFDDDIPFKGYSDASFADDEYTRRSTQGTKYELFGGTTDWKVAKQKSVSKSTTEAELHAASALCDWLLWFQRLFDNIQLDLDQQLTAFCDNRTISHKGVSQIGHKAQAY